MAAGDDNTPAPTPVQETGTPLLHASSISPHSLRLDQRTSLTPKVPQLGSCCNKSSHIFQWQREWGIQGLHPAWFAGAQQHDCFFSNGLAPKPQVSSGFKSVLEQLLFGNDIVSCKLAKRNYTKDNYQWPPTVETFPALLDLFGQSWKSKTEAEGGPHVEDLASCWPPQQEMQRHVGARDVSDNWWANDRFQRAVRNETLNQLQKGGGRVSVWCSVR